MKSKFRMWLNIITICLCCCVIVIGVHAITTAGVTASGKLGFVAHNCKADITSYIYGHAKGNIPDGDPTPQEDKEPLGLVSLNGDAKSIDIGSRYFSDTLSSDGKPEDIVLVLSIKNTSTFKITAKVDSSLTIKPSSIDVGFNIRSADLEVGASVEFVVTLSFIASDSGYANITMPTKDNLSIAINFLKYEEITAGLLHNDNDGFGWHIKMGTVPQGYANAGTEMRWKPFAVKVDGNIEIFENTNTLEAGKTYYFVSEFVLATQNSTQAYGISYCNNYLSTSASSYQNNTYTLAGSNNYATSNLRAYLKSDANSPVYRYYSKDASTSIISESGEQVNFLDYYNIQNSNFFKKYKDANLTARSLSELYELDGKNLDYDTFASNYSHMCTGDYFWPLGYQELICLNKGPNISSSSDGGSNISAQYNIDGTTGASWWMRGTSMSQVYSIGSLLYRKMAHEDHGVRPAFEFTIPSNYTA